MPDDHEMIHPLLFLYTNAGHETPLAI
jgi:hypothetical protein